MKDVIQELNSDPEYVQLKREAREEAIRAHQQGEAGNDYFSGVDAKRIHNDTNGKFFATDSAYYEIGGDFGQMFDAAAHSTCLIAIRDASLPYRLKGKKLLISSFSHYVSLIIIH